MHNNEKIGVGLLTCNRKEFFKSQLDSLLSASDVDEIIIVKNKDFDYGTYLKDLPDKVKYFNIIEDVGIGYCKNVATKVLLDDGCQHVFLIEDDIKIKDTSVFREYIDTAKAFNLQHLIFGAVYTPPSWEIDRILYVKESSGKKIDLYQNLHGGFVYFTRKCLQYCGLFDERYINAIEHIDHTYRIIKMGFYTPFWSFADIHDSQRYLEDSQPGNPSTINDNPLKQQRTAFGFMLFENVWGLQIRQIQPTREENIDKFLEWRKKNG